MKDQLHRVQELVFNYFEDTTTTTLVEVINIFVYHNHSEDEYANTLLDEFLKENDIQNTYINYVSDLFQKDGSKFFRKNSISENGMIDDIKQAFLSLAFNRLKELV